jgi:tetratricopeptide (TPR) repeat protein
MADGNTTAKSRRVRRINAPTTNDAIEIAMGAEASGKAPEGVAAGLLADQRRLIRWEIADRRAAFGLKVAAALTSMALAVTLALAAWSASRASGTVIEPFDTAPALVAHGLDGESVANELVGRVTAMQVAAGSDRPRRESSSGGDRIDVVIPQTGVSIGEVQRLLRAWLGDETYVSGALRPAPEGKLSLSLRIDGKSVPVTPPPPEQQGSADAWIAAGAEAALRETDPYRYATWVTNQGRLTEAERVYRRLIRAGSPEDQAWAWLGLANVFSGRGDMAEALAANANAVRLAPTVDAIVAGMTDRQRLLGHDEWAHFYAQQALRVTDRRDPGKVAARAVQAALRRNDWQTAAREFERLMARQTAGDPQYAPGFVAAYGRALARLHEPRRAMRFTADRDPHGWSLDFDMRATQLALDLRWQELEAIAAQPFRLTAAREQSAANDSILRLPWLAYAMARNGKAAEAREIVGSTPLDCYFCLRVRGWVAALGGAPAEADRWFAEAVRQGPSVADADYEWAEVRLARGDVAGALALARTAARKAPGWADPLKMQGDILASRGELEAAVRLYTAAEGKAPRWGGLRLAHGQALAGLGRREAAEAKWRAAAGMELSGADRARVTALLAGRRA